MSHNIGPSEPLGLREALDSLASFKMEALGMQLNPSTVSHQPILPEAAGGFSMLQPFSCAWPRYSKG